MFVTRQDKRRGRKRGELKKKKTKHKERNKLQLAVHCRDGGG